MQYVDLPCEAQVIGSILKWGYKAVAKIENIDSLEFDDYLNSCTFQACMEILKQYPELDYLDFGTVLKVINKYDETISLGELSKAYDTTLNRIPLAMLNDSVNHLIELKKKRDFSNAIKDIANMVAGDDINNDVSDISYDDLVNKVATTFQNLLRDSNVRCEYEDAQTVLIDYLKHIKQGEVAKIIPTGFNSLDSQLNGGLRSGTLNVIGARPGVGKSAFSANMILNMLRNDKTLPPIVNFSLEMPNFQVMERMISSITGASGKKIQTMKLEPHEYQDLLQGNQECFAHDSKSPRLVLCDKAGLRIENIQSICESINAKFGGIGAICVDYLQLLPVNLKGTTKASAIGELSKALKAMAIQYECPVITPVQLNRDIEKRGKNAIPQVSDIKDSGSIEQDADLVLMLTREQTSGRCYIVKNRNGGIGDINLHFDGDAVRFTESGYSFS